MNKSNWTVKQILVLNTSLLLLVLLIAGGVLMLNLRQGKQANQENLEQIQHSQTFFTELATERLPWLSDVVHQQNLAQQVRSEVLRYVLGETEDIEPLAEVVGNLQVRQTRLDASWPSGLSRKSFEILSGSIAILTDIQKELAEVTSPTQLDEMAEDAFFQVDDLIAAGDTTLKESFQYFGDSIVHASGQNTEKAEELDQIFEQMEFSLIGSISIFFLFLVGLQYGSFRFIGRILTGMVDKLISSADSMLSTSGQITDTSQKISEQASEQASSLEQTSASMEEMAAQTQDNTEHSRTAEQSLRTVGQLIRDTNEKSKLAAIQAQENKQLAETGVNAMGDVASAMEEIRDSSQQITGIVETINDITHQTKMLATNAAIEAARASEQGKGFAVVADEVSKLAENSREAAKEIVELVQGSLSKTQTGNELAQKGEEILKQILEKATNNAGFISEISEISGHQTSEMNSMEQMVGHIHTATKEQADGIEQINRAVIDMNQTTQANAHSAEQGAYSANELSSQANRLRDVVDEVRIHTGSVKNIKTQKPEPLPPPSSQALLDRF